MTISYIEIPTSSGMQKIAVLDVGDGVLAQLSVQYVDGDIQSTDNPGPIRPHIGHDATVNRIPANISPVNILPANPVRHTYLIYNESPAVMYLKFGPNASTSDYTLQIPAGGYYESPQPAHAGQLTAVWSTASGAAQVTECE